MNLERYRYGGNGELVPSNEVSFERSKRSPCHVHETHSVTWFRVLDVDFFRTDVCLSYSNYICLSFNSLFLCLSVSLGVVNRQVMWRFKMGTLGFRKVRELKGENESIKLDSLLFVIFSLVDNVFL